MAEPKYDHVSLANPPTIVPEYQCYNPMPISPATASSYNSPSRPINSSQEQNEKIPEEWPFRAPYNQAPSNLPHDPRAALQDDQSISSVTSRRSGKQEQRFDGVSSFSDNIPLRNQSVPPRKKNLTNDHVYESPLRTNLEERRRSHRRKSSHHDHDPDTKMRLAYVTYALTFVQCVVFIFEIVKNAQLTGSPIELRPSFNLMIGPSPYVLINMGARYVPCMHAVDGIQTRLSGGEIHWPCPNTTSAEVANCQLNNLCGFDMPATQNPAYPGQAIPLNEIKNQPNQWFRFITPIFLHAGIIHIGFNMLIQLTLGKEMEMEIGSIRFFIVYISAGIFGFVLGGNFAATGIASTGASGAIFGILALNLLDLFYTWGERRSPGKELAYILLDIIISFVLGLLPGLDNFSHIGGFLMGLVLGICILHSPNALRQRIDQDAPPYTPVGLVRSSYLKRPNESVSRFVTSPFGFFKGRRSAWWAWWLVRAGSLFLVFIVFILLLKNFYSYRKACSWCKYLSCIDINNWCDIGNLQLTTVS
ncbi:putative rhomboid protein [Podosphaera aphanis]|nr:putative rhomboid protein [Podosphaera aphanis]